MGLPLKPSRQAGQRNPRRNVSPPQQSYQSPNSTTGTPSQQVRATSWLPPTPESLPPSRFPIGQVPPEHEIQASLLEAYRRELDAHLALTNVHNLLPFEEWDSPLDSPPSSPPSSPHIWALQTPKSKVKLPGWSPLAPEFPNGNPLRSIQLKPGQHILIEPEPTTIVYVNPVVRSWKHEQSLSDDVDISDVLDAQVNAEEESIRLGTRIRALGFGFSRLEDGNFDRQAIDSVVRDHLDGIGHQIHVLRNRTIRFHDLERQFRATGNTEVGQEVLGDMTQGSDTLRRTIEALEELSARLPEARDRLRQLCNTREDIVELHNIIKELRSLFNNAGYTTDPPEPDPILQTNEELNYVLANLRTLRNRIFLLSTGNLEFTHTVQSLERVNRLREIHMQVQDRILRFGAWLRQDESHRMYAEANSGLPFRTAMLTAAEADRLWAEIEPLLRWARPDVVRIQGLELDPRVNVPAITGAFNIPRAWDRVAQWVDLFERRLDEMEDFLADKALDFGSEGAPEDAGEAHKRGEGDNEGNADHGDENDGDDDSQWPVIVSPGDTSFGTSNDSPILHPSSSPMDAEAQTLQQMIAHGRALFSEHRSDPLNPNHAVEVYQDLDANTEPRTNELRRLHREIEQHVVPLRRMLGSLLPWYERHLQLEIQERGAVNGQDESFFPRSQAPSFRLAMRESTWPLFNNPRDAGDRYLQPVIDMVEERVNVLEDIEAELNYRVWFVELLQRRTQWLDDHEQYMLRQDIPRSELREHWNELDQLIDLVMRIGDQLNRDETLFHWHEVETPEGLNSSLYRRLHFVRRVYRRIVRTIPGGDLSNDREWFIWRDMSELTELLRDWGRQIGGEIMDHGDELFQREGYEPTEPSDTEVDEGEEPPRDPPSDTEVDEADEPPCDPPSDTEMDEVEEPPRHPPPDRLVLSSEVELEGGFRPRSDTTEGSPSQGRTEGAVGPSPSSRRQSASPRGEFRNEATYGNGSSRSQTPSSTDKRRSPPWSLESEEESSPKRRRTSSQGSASTHSERASQGENAQSQAADNDLAPAPSRSSDQTVQSETPAALENQQGGDEVETHAATAHPLVEVRIPPYRAPPGPPSVNPSSSSSSSSEDPDNNVGPVDSAPPSLPPANTPPAPRVRQGRRRLSIGSRCYHARLRGVRTSVLQTRRGIYAPNLYVFDARGAVLVQLDRGRYHHR